MLQFWISTFWVLGTGWVAMEGSLGADIFFWETKNIEKNNIKTELQPCAKRGNIRCILNQRVGRQLRKGRNTTSWRWYGSTLLHKETHGRHWRRGHNWRKNLMRKGKKNEQAHPLPAQNMLHRRVWPLDDTPKTTKYFFLSWGTYTQKNVTSKVINSDQRAALDKYG